MRRACTIWVAFWPSPAASSTPWTLLPTWPPPHRWAPRRRAWQSVTLVTRDAPGRGGKAAYLARLQELQDEAAEAESWNDPERSARAQQEIAFLTDELKGAVGSAAAIAARRPPPSGLASASRVRCAAQLPASRSSTRHWEATRRHGPNRHVLLLPARSAGANRLGL